MVRSVSVASKAAGEGFQLVQVSYPILNAALTHLDVRVAPDPACFVQGGSAATDSISFHARSR